MITSGIDEAGRGPVIGPMVMACCCFDENGIAKLKELNVKDSKQITPKRREFLEEKIKEIALKYIIKKISPVEIDETRKKISLNDIEAKEISEMLSELDKTMTNMPSVIYVDSPENIQENFTKKILKFYLANTRKFSKSFDFENSLTKISVNIISEHFADSKYIEVSAASILAKVERDREIENLKKIYGDFGSGYPSDPKTVTFLKNNESQIPREIIRKSWNVRFKEENNKDKKEKKEYKQAKLIF
ncbi:Ribonuclease HII [groundwater metagenome]|uniref:Ribonuclease HII n=1 Tax=groundwater metagenome TaxID=717931 RepID=A0A098ED22_9ZZZZ